MSDRGNEAETPEGMFHELATERRWVPKIANPPRGDCVVCGGPLAGRRRVYCSDECRSWKPERVCQWPGCENVLTGSHVRWCSKRCEQRNARKQRREREEYVGHRIAEARSARLAFEPVWLEKLLQQHGKTLETLGNE